MSHVAILLEKSIIKTLLYYDIFNYPLRADEVFRFLGTNSITLDDVKSKLNVMVLDQKIFCRGELYSLHNEEHNFTRRIKGNKSAEHYLTLAHKKAMLLSAFPFVRAVFASGSLSKGYMDETSDLDFFIVTAPNRLWITRTLIVLYKRIFLLNSHKYFCCNYFVDTDHLEIEEKNLFTATELATVLPLYGALHYERMMKANSWLHHFFPNYHMRSTENVRDFPPGIFKRLMEKFLSLAAGNWLERYCMKMTSRRWDTLYGKKYRKKDFAIAFKSKKSVSKNHPRHFQEKVIQLYQDKLKWFSGKHNMELESVNP